MQLEPMDGRRRRRWPRKRWRDDLEAFMDWSERKINREKWKSMGKTFAQQWDSIRNIYKKIFLLFSSHLPSFLNAGNSTSLGRKIHSVWKC